VTDEEAFWAGEFGTEYTSRNEKTAPELLPRWGRMLTRAFGGVSSALELGANVGLNLQAIAALLPNCKLSGVEINATAYKRLAQLANVNAIHSSIFDFETDERFDLTFTSGVLIHINPDRLRDVYEKLYSLSRRYVLLCEYYNPTPVTVPYRGHADRLYKRDWAGEMLQTYRDLRLVDYGFFYRNDPLFPADDLTWFLLEKRA